jgi:hypothetical protein
LARAVGSVANGEDVAGVLIRNFGGFADRVFGAAQVAGDDVAQRPVIDLRDGSEVVAEEAGDGLGSVVGDGGVEAEIAGEVGRVPLPAECGDGVALAEEPGVA